MKNFTLIAIILGFIFFSAASAQAQSRQRITVEIPFEFTVNNKKFDAGKYVISRLDYSTDPRVLHLQSLDGKTQAIFSGTPVVYRDNKGNGGVKLTFNRYAERYFLAGIFSPADSLTMEVGKGRDEVEIARQFKNRKTGKIDSVILIEEKN